MGNSTHSRLSKEGGSASDGITRSLRHKSLSRKESSGDQNKRNKDGSSPAVPAENGPNTKLMAMERTTAIKADKVTERQIELLIETWKELEENIARVGVIMYIGLFETHPDVQEVFMPFKGLELDELKHSKQLRSHALRVMAFVQKAVARLHEPEKLDALLRELGKKHHGYSAKKEYIDLIGPQFIQAIKPSLEDRWTDEIHEAWTALFKYMAYMMKSEIELEEKKAAGTGSAASSRVHPAPRPAASARSVSSGNPKNHGNRRASSDVAGGGGIGGGIMGNSRRGTLH